MFDGETRWMKKAWKTYLTAWYYGDVPAVTIGES